MPENAIIPDGNIPNEGVVSGTVKETAKEKFERERLSRRQALKRFGMTSAMATFAMFSVDDLARMVGTAMQQRARDNKIAGQIAREFQGAGVALAGSPSSPTSCGYPCQYCGTVFAAETKNVYDCQGACSDCCTPSFWHPFPCGLHADAVVTMCQDVCHQCFPNSGV